MELIVKGNGSFNRLDVTGEGSFNWSSISKAYTIMVNWPVIMFNTEINFNG
jgi:hypothetical protein